MRLQKEWDKRWCSVVIAPFNGAAHPGSVLAMRQNEKSALEDQTY